MTDMSFQFAPAQPLDKMSEGDLRALKGAMMQTIREDRSKLKPLLAQIARINAYIRASEQPRR